MSKSILIKSGRIIDPASDRDEVADLLIVDGKIEKIGQITSASQSTAVYDADGMIVSPGFIDVHSHGDLEVLEHRKDKISQGVTTEVVGNCGFSLFPKLCSSALVPSFDLFDRRDRDWVDASDYFNNLQKGGSLSLIHI